MLSALGLQVWWLPGCMNTLPPPWQEAITWCSGRPKGDAHRYPQGAALALPPFICPQAALGVFASSWLPSQRTRLCSSWEIFLPRPSLSNSLASSLSAHGGAALPGTEMLPTHIPPKKGSPSCGKQCSTGVLPFLNCHQGLFVPNSSKFAPSHTETS